MGKCIHAKRRRDRTAACAKFSSSVRPKVANRIAGASQGDAWRDVDARRPLTTSDAERIKEVLLASPGAIIDVQNVVQQLIAAFALINAARCPVPEFAGSVRMPVLFPGERL